jgi:hypothetical protein
MNIQNFNFFDKFGKNLNLEFDNTAGIWKGAIYFEPISAYLFDNENLFILEKVGANYKFPTLSQNESLVFSWKDSKNYEEFFLYDVVRDLELQENFINRVESKTVAHSDYSTSPSSLDLRFPLQVNIAFNPATESKYERILQVRRQTPTVNELVAEIYFYGEGEEEEDRFKVWCQNFGIKFVKEDANVLKDYDIKEAFPDLEALNKARKSLLVNKEEIFPYIGTYRGLANFVNILGYKDVLRVKEYWINSNPRSPYFNTLTMVDLTDYLDDGKIDTLDLVDANRGLREGSQFKKTEFLAIVYEFTQVTGEFDDDGIPLVQETTEFSVNEIFYKLDRLGKKLKNEFIPINVKIRDVIGEFIYFQKLTINYWSDSTKIRDYDINEPAKIEAFPGTDTNLVLRSLDPLYRKAYPEGIDFGVVQLNESSKNPFESFQFYTRPEIPGIIDYIESFYSEIKNQRIPDLSARLSWEFGDDPERVIGAPVVLRANVGKFTINDLRGVRIDDLDAIAPGLDPYWTLGNIDFKNYYEINWRIIKASPNPYNFEYRGKLVDLYELPHFLPYAGEYRVIIELFDFTGNVSTFSKVITVSDQMKPEIIAFTRLEDKFEYSIKNLDNVRLQDFGASPLYYPKVNVLNNEDAAVKINIYKNLLEWISFYKNSYGLGQNMYLAELYNQNTGAFVPYLDPTQSHPEKLSWGLGENDTPIKIKDFRDIKVGDLYWMRITDLIYLDDFKAGFYINVPKPGSTIRLSLYSDYIVPNYSTIDELLQILNESNHPAIRLFNYELINGQIHAQAEYLSKIMYHMLFSSGEFSPSPAVGPIASPGGGNGGGGNNKNDEYTFFLPKKVFSNSVISYLQSLSPIFDVETMFLLAKTSDVINGAVQDPTFWRDEKYWKFVNDEQIGYLPTTIDQNAFNITDIKLFNGTFAAPKNAICFFVVNNLDAKSEFFWTLTNSITGEEIIKVRSVPFFVWKFKDLGNFTLTVDVRDNRKTKYETVVQNFIRVLNKRTYVDEIETRLNERKVRLLKNKPY